MFCVLRTQTSVQERGRRGVCNFPAASSYFQLITESEPPPRSHYVLQGIDGLGVPRAELRPCCGPVSWHGLSGSLFWVLLSQKLD